MPRPLRLLDLVLCLCLMATAAPALARTEITWFGHAAFRVQTPSGKVVLIDPWIANPVNKTGKEDLAKLDRADLILVTHGHFDHVGDSVEIAKRTGAKLVATFDLGKALVRYAGYPEQQFGFDSSGNFGGEIVLLDGEVKVAFVPAVHSSTVASPDGAKDIHDGGAPGGFVLTVRGGPRIYHTGDTDVFYDMGQVRHYGQIDLMLAAIGDTFTMGPYRAARAVGLVKPKMVVPMHYGTFPVLTGTPDAFRKALKRLNSRAQLRVIEPGATFTLP